MFRVKDLDVSKETVNDLGFLLSKRNVIRSLYIFDTEQYHHVILSVYFRMLCLVDNSTFCHGLEVSSKETLY